jgi:hypothetical protein
MVVLVHISLLSYLLPAFVMLLLIKSRIADLAVKIALLFLY